MVYSFNLATPIQWIDHKSFNTDFLILLWLFFFDQWDVFEVCYLVLKCLDIFYVSVISNLILPVKIMHIV